MTISVISVIGAFDITVSSSMQDVNVVHHEPPCISMVRASFQCVGGRGFVFLEFSCLSECTSIETRSS